MLLVVALATIAGGCATTPPVARTTFLRSVDLIEMTDRMAERMTSDPVIGARTPASDPWTISIERIANRTNQIIPDGEKWLYIARLRGRLEATEFAAERSIRWIMPPERWAQVAAELESPAEPRLLREPPTHRLTGDFRALTETSATGRRDTYVCSYQLIDLLSGVLTWEGQWEVSRATRGLTYD
ncbi:MAG: hypothetical protein AB8G96_10975 [Phycisphaerales bacterium]